MNDLFLVLVLVSLVCLPVALIAPQLFKNRKTGVTPSRKVLGLIFGGSLVLFFILFGVTSSSSTSNEKVTATATPQAPTSTPVPSSSPLSPIEQQIQLAVTKVFDKDTSVKTSYDAAATTADITYGEGDSFWDEKAMVQGLITMFVKSSREVFKIDGVDNISITIKTTFTDSYGQPKVEGAADIIMSKEEFEKFNWDNLEGMPIYDRIVAVASEFYIHPSVRKQINLEELTLSL